MPKENNKNKAPFYVAKFKILITLLLLAILVPGYLFFVKPEYQAYQKNKSLFDNQQSELEQAIKELLDHKKIILSYQEIDSLAEEKINQILPSDVNESDLYVNFSSLVERVGLVLDDISIQLITSSDKDKSSRQADLQATQEKATQTIRGELGEIQVDLSLSDVSYIKIKNLMDLLESNLRLVDVQSFHFNAQEGSLSLMFKTYYLK